MAIGTRLRGAGSAVALAVCLVLAGCGQSDAPAERAVSADPSTEAATVNGQIIYVSDVELEARVKGLIDPGETLEIDSAEFNEILDQLIDIKLLAMEAIGRGLDEEPEARHRLTTARDNILGNILMERIVEERVDEAAIRKMYETQVSILTLDDEAHVRHILAPTKEAIDKIAAELKSGTDFAVLASRRSTDEATRMDGGDLGYINADEATPEFAKVIRDTPTGGVSKPFEDQTGWHIVKIDERRKEQPPSIEELRAPILEHLTRAQIGDVLKQLRNEAEIEKKTSPRNSRLDVDPAPATITPAPAAPRPPSFDASAPPPPVSESRDATPAAPPSAAAATPPATTTKPATPATTPPAAPKPAATKPAAPGGPVSESRKDPTQ